MLSMIRNLQAKFCAQGEFIAEQVGVPGAVGHRTDEVALCAASRLSDLQYRMATFTSTIIIVSSIFSNRWAFRELRDIAEMKFRFAEEEDACEYVTRLASELHLFAPAHVLKVCSLPFIAVEPLPKIAGRISGAEDCMGNCSRNIVGGFSRM